MSVKKVRTRGGDGDAEPRSLARDGENAASALTMMRLVKPSGEPNNGAQREELAGVDEESPVRMESSQRHYLPHGGRQLSWWDHGRCLGVGLSLGPMDTGGIRGGIAREDAHESRSTPQSTQVWGPRVEVKPLLLHLSLCISLYSRVKRTLDRVTMVLLELYPGYESAARELLV